MNARGILLPSEENLSYSNFVRELIHCVVANLYTICSRAILLA